MKWSDNSGNFTPAPAGTHVARCIKILDLGTQKEEWQGDASFKQKVLVAWELPTELIQDGEKAGQPFVVSKFYTQSLSEKANLRKDLETWRNRPFTATELEGFDAKNILGKPCLLTIVHTDKGKVKVSAVTSVPKGMAVPPQVNPSVYFSLEEFDEKVFATLSDKLKQMVMASPEYQQLVNPNTGPGQSSDWTPGDPPADLDDTPF